MELTPHLLETQQFPEKFRGYDCDAVEHPVGEQRAREQASDNVAGGGGTLEQERALGGFADFDGNGDVNLGDFIALSDNFGTILATPAMDFGDAPEPYPTTLVEGQAFHRTTVIELTLVPTIDSETDGTHSDEADDEVQAAEA